MEDSKGFALRMGRGGIPRQVKPAVFEASARYLSPGRFGRLRQRAVTRNDFQSLASR